MLDNIHEKAQVYTLEKALIGEARVINKDDNMITLLFFKDVIFNLNEDVLIVLASDVYGLLTYRCKIMEFELSKSSDYHKKAYVAKFSIMELMRIIQRRKDIKVKVKFLCKIILLDSTGHPLLDDQRKKPLEYDVMVKDISASGMLFISTKKFKINQRFSFLFNHSSEPFEVKAEIVRYQDEGEGRTGYGCRFVELYSSKEAIIRQYVFKMQVLMNKVRG